MLHRRTRRVIPWSRLSPEARRRWRRLAIRCLVPLTLLTVIAIVVPACTDLAQVQAAREEASTVRSHLETQAGDFERQLAELPPDDPSRPAIEARLASSRTAIDTLSQGMNEIDRAMAAATAEPSPSDAAGAVAAFLPEPWRTSVVLGGAAVALLWRARQLKVGLRSVAKGIELAKKDDEAFRKSFNEHATTFRSVQTGTAQKVVDEVTSPGFITLPI